jgi:hypothetical protein
LSRKKFMTSVNFAVVQPRAHFPPNRRTVI